MISQTLTRTEAPPQIASPIILPLFMPSGKPYWYIPTERLTQVSEQLSIGASPSAIAHEAYYSSALDGAVEYSNHTQQAILSVLQSPHAPIDAAFVETVASLLSGARTGFRVADIPGTPPPSAISWHMELLYRFIPDDRYHPLVKSAVCHSFVLAVQPYNNCSGRLARLLTMMILIRSGYTFLLNSSYSAVIARRSNEYAYAFQSIFTSDNTYGQAGNQTGFVEFSIDVLAEALDTLRSQSAVTTPHAHTKPPVVAAHPVATTSTEFKPDIISRPERPQDRSNDDQGGAAHDRSRSAVNQDVSVTSSFEAKLTILDLSKSPLVRKTATVVREMLGGKTFVFTKHDWIKKTGMTTKEFEACRDTLKRYNLICVERKNGNNKRSLALYRLTPDAEQDKEDDQETQSDKQADEIQQSDDQLDVIQPSDSPEQTAFGESPGAVEQPMDLPILTEMENSRFETVRNTAAIYRNFLQRGSTEFTTEEWVAQTGQSSREFHKSYEILAKRHLIDCVEKAGRYRLTPKCVTLLSPSIFWARIEALENSKSANVRKGAAAVRKMIEEGYAGFTSQQWERKTGMLLIEFGTFRNRLFENQLIVNENKGTSTQKAFYRFTLNGLCNFFDTQSPIAKNGREEIEADVHMDMDEYIIEEIAGKDPQSFINYLNELSFSRSEVVKRGAAVIRAMIAEGEMSFSRKEWMKRANMTDGEYATCYSAMSSRGMIRRLPKERHREATYAFNWPAGTVLPEPNYPEIQKRYIKVNRYSPIFKQLAPLVPIEDFPKKALAAMTGATHHITESEWAAVNHLSPEEAARDMNILCYMGIVTRRYYQRLNAFSYHVLRPEKLKQMLESGEMQPPKDFDNLPFWASLSHLAGMKSSITKQAADTVREMVDAGVFYFTPCSWVRRTGMNKNQYQGCVKVMESQRVAVEDGSLLRLTIAPQGTPIDYCELIGIEKTVSEAQIERIKTYASCAVKGYDKRIGAFLLRQIDAGSCYFTMEEYAQANPLSVTTLNKDMLRARRLGLIRRYLALGTVVYALSYGLDGQAFPDPSCEGPATVEKRDCRLTLTPLRKHRLTDIYNTFGTHEFTRRKLEEIFHVTDARHTIDPLLSLNLIIERQSMRNLYYRLAVTPDDRPECFEASTGNPSHENKVAIIESSPTTSQGSAHQTRLAKRREAYATQSPEKLEARRAQMRSRARARRAAETPEEREDRLSKEQERRHIIKATETPEEHESKLATQRAAYAAQSPEKLEARRSQMRAWVRNRNAAETPEEHEKRLAVQREQQRIKRAAETPEEHEKKLAAKREKQRNRRAAETPEEHEKRLAAKREYTRRKKGIAAVNHGGETP